MNKQETGATDGAVTQSVIEIITRNFVETGDGLTVKEIAQAAGLSETKVRKALADVGYSDGVCSEKETRANSGPYSNFVGGHHQVMVYSPTRQHLAKVIRTRGLLAQAAATPPEPSLLAAAKQVVEADDAQTLNQAHIEYLRAQCAAAEKQAQFGPCGQAQCPEGECCKSPDCRNLPSFREIARIAG